jgi:hypothetical protein
MRVGDLAMRAESLVHCEEELIRRFDFHNAFPSHVESYHVVVTAILSFSPSFLKPLDPLNPLLLPLFTPPAHPRLWRHLRLGPPLPSILRSYRVRRCPRDRFIQIHSRSSLPR